MRRHVISNDPWRRMSRIFCLDGKAIPGAQPRIIACWSIQSFGWTKTGDRWRELPERWGNWNSVWRRFDRWARKGGLGMRLPRLPVS
jgi:hypothetical protein